MSYKSRNVTFVLYTIFVPHQNNSLLHTSFAIIFSQLILTQYLQILHLLRFLFYFLLTNAIGNKTISIKYIDSDEIYKMLIWILFYSPSVLWLMILYASCSWRRIKSYLSRWRTFPMKVVNEPSVWKDRILFL